MRPVFNKIDYMNLPDPHNNLPKDVVKDSLHVLDFLFDDRSQIMNNEPFKYYRYMGSMT